MSELNLELKKQMEEFMEQKTGVQILAVLGFCAYIVGLYIGYGFVLFKAWAWIIMPLALPAHLRPLGIIQCMALSTAISLFTGHQHVPEYKGKFTAELFIQPIATMLSLLGLLWVLSRFI